MTFLYLDTALDPSWALLVRDQEIIGEITIPSYFNSQNLMPELIRLLEENQLKLNHLDFLGVGLGPGSYTGIRVGVMIAKACRLALGSPLVGISSLQCFNPPQNGPFIVLIDAKMGGLYVQKGEKKGNKTTFTKPLLVTMADWPSFWKGETLITPHKKVLEQKLQTELIEVKPNGELVKNQLLEMQPSDALEILYLRQAVV